MPVRFITLDDPNASKTIFHGTIAWGINNNGQIVGRYYAAGATNATGFMFSDGSFTDLNLGAAYHNIVPAGINDFGVISGWLQDSTNKFLGFITGGGFTDTISDPNAVNGTLGFGVSDLAVVVGGYYDAGNQLHPFSYANGDTSDDYTFATNATFVGINALTTIGVGFSIDGGGKRHGFAYGGPLLVKIDDPQAGPAGTLAYGVNDKDQVVGYYTDPTGYYHGFLYNILTKTYTTIDVPGAMDTIITGINDAGRMTGYWYDSASVPHGFETITSVPHDFSGDGHADILWRSASGLVEWSMSGGSITSNGNVSYLGGAANPDPSWSIVSESDFNGDGNADIFWRNSGGSLAIWAMNGSNIIATSSVTSGGAVVAPDASWNVAGTGDFNGDGMADILWRNTAGAMSLWTMNGGAITASSPITSGGAPLSPDASWSIVGFGDLNGDGNADILWRNTSGDVAVWFMNGSAVTGGGDLGLASVPIKPDASWSIAGVGDFNGDGNADILWRNTAGSLVVWLMNGSAITSSTAVTLDGAALTPDASWHVVEIGDFQGLGRSSILWRSDGGATSLWLMNGAAVASATNPSVGGTQVSPDPSWHVQANPTNFG